jgi:putative ABC transport system permease protein
LTSKRRSSKPSQSLAQEQLFASLLSFFGLLALALASLRLYGILAASVTQRTQEIGIRIALGAQAGNVLKLVISRGMKLVLLGAGRPMLSVAALLPGALGIK